MNNRQLEELLRPHGLGLKIGDGGRITVVGKALEALADQGMKVYEIKCRHEVDITYRVAGTSFKEARDKLCGVELFQERDGEFGPSEYYLDREGIEIVDTYCYGDPSPTGTPWTRRNWEYTEENDDD